MKKQLLPHAAAAQLNCSNSTLKKSRHTGKLSGVDAPRYVKRGRRVFYDPDVLDEWQRQFNSYQNTSEYKLEGGEA